ncbi:triple QxxK/R motif-containing protein isoform X1 [Kogia breviceps]|uniref:triple QxxK/R motif-containing protein isoform X1 n=1 Tax=Kogia breviceps TaxID=27615 RepID=UPI0034D21E7C
MHRDEDWPPLAVTRESPCTEMKTQHSQSKQDYKKTKPILRATKLKAEAKKTAIGIKEVGLLLAAILALLLAFYAFFYLRLSTDVDPDLEPDED